MGILSYKKSIDADRRKAELEAAKAKLAENPEALEEFSQIAVFGTAVGDAAFFPLDKYRQLGGKLHPKLLGLFNRQSAALDSCSQTGGLSERFAEISDSIASEVMQWAGEDKDRLLCGAFFLTRSQWNIFEDASEKFRESIGAGVKVSTCVQDEIGAILHGELVKAKIKRVFFTESEIEIFRIVTKAKINNNIK